MISEGRAARLRETLDPFVKAFDPLRGIANDPVEAPRRYRDPADQEVAGLLASCLAYGRVELFKPRIFEVLAWMGPSPSRFAASFDPARDGGFLETFSYRFHRGGDVGALLAGAGEVIREEGSLGRLVAREWQERGELGAALSAFSRRIRDAGARRIAGTLQPPAALDHLLPDPAKGGASKRLLLYLRWMVRRDAVDLGAWEDLLPRSALLIPLDTHILRISRLLGLTRRKDASWRTSEAITASLRRLDPEDPVRYDFALCHLGISGACPTRRDRARCEVCPLRTECIAGRAMRPQGKASPRRASAR